MKKIILVILIFLITITSFLLIYKFQNKIQNNKKKLIPDRIISCGPLITEQLYLLNVEDKIIANTVYCEKPEQAKYKEKIGDLVNINIEKIINLNPDIILMTKLTNKKDYEKLVSYGIKVEVFDYAKNYEELKEQFLRIGRLVNKEEYAKKLLSETETEIEKIKNKTKNLIKKQVFVELGNKPLFTVSGESFINDFIEIAGGENIFKDLKIGFISKEQVLMKNPDIIIITGMGIESNDELKMWYDYKSLNAVKNNKIFIIDSYLLCSPNGVTSINAIKELIKIIHPEVNIE